MRAEGYDQLGEDEKEVLACGNCFNDVSYEQLSRYATVNGSFCPPLPNLPELNVIEECLMAAQLPFQQIREINWFAEAKKFVWQVINEPVELGSWLKVLLRKLFNDLILNMCVKSHIFHKSGPFRSLVNVSSLRKWLAYLAKSPLYTWWNIRVDPKLYNSEETLSSLVEKKKKKLKKSWVSKSREILFQ